MTILRTPQGEVGCQETFEGPRRRHGVGWGDGKSVLLEEGGGEDAMKLDVSEGVGRSFLVEGRGAGERKEMGVQGTRG